MRLVVVLNPCQQYLHGAVWVQEVIPSTHLYQITVTYCLLFSEEIQSNIVISRQIIRELLNNYYNEPKTLVVVDRKRIYIPDILTR